MLRDNGAMYPYGFLRGRARALNDDLSTPAYNNILGGAGPFDYSSLTATITSIPIFFKVNDGAVVSETFDLAEAVDKAAVTVDELVTALTAAVITGWTFAKDVATGRIKMVNSTTGAYVQVYGIGARLMKIGQGWGVKAIKGDTFQSLSETPTMKEDTTQTVTDASLRDTEVIIPGYVKGWSGALVDTAEDFELWELVEGGTLSADGKIYNSPTSASRKPMFEIETYGAYYSKGTNYEESIVAYRHATYKMCKGSVGEKTYQAGFTTSTFNIVGTEYKPKGNGVTATSGIIVENIAPEDWSPESFDAI